MATLDWEGQGARISWVAGDKRPSIRLGQVTSKAANSFKVHFEHFLANHKIGVLTDQSAEWLSTLSNETHGKLADKGLVVPRQATPGQHVRVVEHVENYIKSKVDVSGRTRVIFGDVKANLADYFGPAKFLRDVTPGDVDQFRLFMVGKHYAEATIRKRLAMSKQFFRSALRSGLIKANPFDGQKLQVRGNEKRFHFVTMEEFQAVLEACPSTEWQILWTMARIGGVRMPSEVCDLKWTDVDFGRGVVTIKSPKTAHHGPGHDERQVPLFPEMHTVLANALHEASEGANYVIAKHRSKAVNLRTHMERIIRRAGLTPWPKLWQNCRASREIELCQSFPEHVVAKWVGHNQVTARGFYLKVLPSDFTKAAGWSAAPQIVPAATVSEPAQIPAQSQATLAWNSLHEGGQSHRGNPVFQGNTGDLKSLQNKGMRVRGVEPLRAYRS